MFEHRTEVTGGLSVNPQSFSEVNNGQKRTFFVRVNTDMVHSEIPQNRSAGAGTGKKYNAIVTKQFYDCAKEALRSTKPKLVHKRWHRKNKIWSHRNDVFFFNGTKEAFRATLVDAAGTVELLLSCLLYTSPSPRD